jgi:hypothetical protein
MMKKILVLMLVLGIASMATAGLTITGPTTVAPGGTVTLTLVADPISGTGDYGYVYVGGPGADPVSLITMLTALSDGGMSGVNFTGNTYTYFYFVGANTPGQPPPYLASGNWINFNVTASVTPIGGVIPISVVSFLGYTGDSHPVTVIPEPMTIGLLGLGGLLLRRRK